MLNLKIVFRTIGFVSAGLLLFCASANAAAQEDKSSIASDTHKITGFQKETLEGGASPSSIGLGSDEMTAPAGVTDPTGSGEDFGDDNPMPQHGNNYFMRKFTEAKAHDQGPVGGIAPAGENLGEPMVDPTLEGIQRQFDMPPNVEPLLASEKVMYGSGPVKEPPTHPRYAGNGNRRQAAREWDDYWESQESSDRSCRPGEWDANDQTKYDNWGDADEGEEGAHPADSEQFSDGEEQGGSKGKKWSDNGGTDTVDEDKPDEVETGAKPEGDRDTDPEGDDPDEFKSPLSEKFAASPAVSTSHVMAERHFAAAGAQRAGMGSEGGIGSLPQIAQQEQGGGLPSVHAVEILGTPDPEDGGPDELASPAATHVMQNGDNLQPEPGGEDPDDPTASQGGLTTVSATMSDTASPAEPGEGGQGGGIVPDDPRF